MPADRPSLMARTIAALRRHPIVSALVTLATLIWLGFGVVIGGIPFFGITWLAVVGGSWITLAFLARRRAKQPTATDGEGARAAPTSIRRDGAIVLGIVAIIAFALFGLIQLVPYGHPQTYAAGTGEPAWATPRTRELMVNACFDCHSNEPTYPWYSSIAPVSWTVQHHIDEGRETVNYSNFATNPRSGNETVEVIQEGSMPPGYYTTFGLHPKAKLTDAERAELIAGLQATPGFQGGGERESRRHERDDDGN